MNYSITLKKGFFKKQVLNDVKGHLFPNDLPNHIMMVIMEDESKFFINMNKWDSVEISKELFAITAKNIEKETHGQVKLEY